MTIKFKLFQTDEMTDEEREKMKQSLIDESEKYLDEHPEERENMISG